MNLHLMALLVRYGGAFLLNAAGMVVTARAVGPAAWGEMALMLAGYNLGTFWGYGFFVFAWTRPDLVRRGGASGWWLAVMISLAVALGTRWVALPMVVGAVVATLLGMASWPRFLVSGLVERQGRFGLVLVLEMGDILVFNGLLLLMSTQGGWGASLTPDMLMLLAGRCLVGVLACYGVCRRRWGLRLEHRRLPWRACLRAVMTAGLAQWAVWAPGNWSPAVVGSQLEGPLAGLIPLAARVLEYPKVLGTMGQRLVLGAGDELARFRRLVGLVAVAVAVVQVLAVILAELWVPLVFGPRWHGLGFMMAMLVPASTLGVLLPLTIAFRQRSGLTFYSRDMIVVSLVHLGCAWLGGSLGWWWLLLVGDLGLLVVLRRSLSGLLPDLPHRWILAGLGAITCLSITGRVSMAPLAVAAILLGMMAVIMPQKTASP